MYLGHYQFSEEPFHITPDPSFLFASPTHREALASLSYGVEQRKGFIAIIGEVGAGKTIVLRSFLERCTQEHQRVIYIFNPNVSFEDLIWLIHRELGVAIRTIDLAGMIEGLHLHLIEEYKRGRNVVLILDEAQNIPIETLENLRMLSNLETDKDKLIQIVLAGQPELQSLLDRKELRQLKQRIAVRAVIEPLGKSESMAYILHRLDRVAMGDGQVFSRGALRRIARTAKGIPRTINVLCDNALIAGLGYQRKLINSGIVKEVARDLSKQPVSKSASYPTLRTSKWGVMGVAAGLLTMFFLLHHYRLTFVSFF